MPPQKIQPPQFSLTGRYLINVQERKVEGPTYFHDTENLQTQCGIEDIPTDSMSRFNGKAWAIQRGYTSCRYCIG